MILIIIIILVIVIIVLIIIITDPHFYVRTYHISITTTTITTTTTSPLLQLQISLLYHPSIYNYLHINSLMKYSNWSTKILRLEIKVAPVGPSHTPPSTSITSSPH